VNVRDAARSTGSLAATLLAAGTNAAAERLGRWSDRLADLAERWDPQPWPGMADVVPMDDETVDDAATLIALADRLQVQPGCGVDPGPVV
jgi:hypothetical protein